MTDVEERDARLKQIVEDVKSTWATGKKKMGKLTKAEKRQFAPPVPSIPKVVLEPQDDIIPLPELHAHISRKKEAREKLAKKHKLCTSCGSKDNLTVDHIIPVAVLKLFGIRRLATYDYEKHKKNLTLLCHTCNQAKGNKVDLSDKKIRRILLWYIKNHDTL